MSLRRSAALTAAAISGAERAKNSRSWSFSRSHGGLPITQSKPGASGRPKTAGKVASHVHRLPV